MSAILNRLKNKGGGNDSNNSVIYCHIHDAGIYIMIAYLMFFYQNNQYFFHSKGNSFCTDVRKKNELKIY